MKAKLYLFVFTTLAVGFISTLNSNLFAQEVRKPQKIRTEETSGFIIKYGTGLTTRYIWRGLDVAKSPALLPYGQLIFAGLELSVYGVYGLFENAAKHPDFVRPQNPEDFNPIVLDKIAFNEVITNLFFRFKPKFGNIRIGVTEYYFPDGLVKKLRFVDTTGVEYFDYPPSTWLNWDDNGEGAHTIEANIKYEGNKKFPAWLLIAYNIYNDPENSLYIEAGYIFDISQNKLTLTLGTAIGASSWYQFNFKNGEFRGDYATHFSFAFNREIYLSDWLIVDFALTDVIAFYEERNSILFTTTIRIE